MIQIDSKIVRHASIHLLRQFAFVQDDPLAVGETALIVLDDLRAVAQWLYSSRAIAFLRIVPKP